MRKPQSGPLSAWAVSPVDIVPLEGPALGTQRVGCLVQPPSPFSALYQHLWGRLLGPGWLGKDRRVVKALMAAEHKGTAF